MQRMHRAFVLHSENHNRQRNTWDRQAHRTDASYFISAAIIYLDEVSHNTR